MFRALQFFNLFAAIGFFSLRAYQETKNVWSGPIAHLSTAYLLLFSLTWLVFVGTFTIRFVEGRREEPFCRIWLIISTFLAFLFFSGLMRFVL
jgi:hypothetical protein